MLVVPRLRGYVQTLYQRLLECRDTGIFRRRCRGGGCRGGCGCTPCRVVIISVVAIVPTPVILLPQPPGQARQGGEEYEQEHEANPDATTAT